MSNNQRFRWGTKDIIRHDITAGDVVEIGDISAVVSGKAVPFSDFTYTGGVGGTYASLALAQEAACKVFLGIASEASRAASATNLVDAFTSREYHEDGVFEFNCASASFAVNDLVGPAGNATDTTFHLENQKVVAVTVPERAIGRVVRATSSATKCLVRIFPKMLRGLEGAGKSYNVTFTVAAAEITNANIITGYTPGHPFQLEALDAYVTSALTGSSKTVTINPEIDTVDVTGGVAVVASASAALGTRVAGTAITAGGVGGSASVIDIEGSSVTAFTGGFITINLRIRNLA